MELDCYTNNFPGLPCFKKLMADKLHMLAESLLVPFLIINLTHLTAGVYMKLRFKSKVTRGFTFSLLHDSCSPLRDLCLPLHGSLAALSCGEKSRKTSGTRVTMFLFSLDSDFVFGKKTPCQLLLLLNVPVNLH